MAHTEKVGPICQIKKAETSYVKIIWLCLFRGHNEVGLIVMNLVPSTRRSMLGDRAFPVASARAWNSLPSSVRNAPPLTMFRRELKTVLFRSSFDND